MFFTACVFFSYSSSKLKDKQYKQKTSLAKANPGQSWVSLIRL